jgi:4-hydroxy-tetrahydrodipicolinate synthase
MTTTTTFQGVLPALITPFAPDGSAVDYGALETLVERCIVAGVGGLVATGSTGEFTTLTPDERRRVVEAVVATADGRVPTVAATGALSTREAIELSQHAEEAGAAAVMIVPPFYGPLAWPEVVAHYREVANRISIPIMYYHLPIASGTALTVERLRDLGEVGVTCYKDSSGDAVAAAAVLHAGGDLPTLLNGADTLTFSALAAGVRGVVWGAASFIPGPCVELHRLVAEEADLAAARRLWARIYPICELLEATTYAAGVKAGCRHVGLATGPVRLPLLEVTAAESERLAALIDELLAVAVA